MPQKARVLVVDPEIGFRETLVRLLALEGYEARGTGSAEEAVAWLETEPFGLVLCDRRLASADGMQLAQRVRCDWPQTGLLVLIAPEDLLRPPAGSPAVADDYLEKARCRDDLSQAAQRALEKARLRVENHDLRRSLDRAADRRTRELRRSLRQVGRAYRLALESLVAALDAREGETQRHSRRVAYYTSRLAVALGVPERDRRDMYHGALLHDLGKIGIPDAILLKPASLTAEEWRVMKSHPRLGHAIVRDLPFLKAAAACVLGHHERWDGTGYPLGIPGKELARSARIVSVADAIDAMSVRRPYRNPLPFARIIAELMTNRELQFDPEVVDAALDLFKDWCDLHPDVMRYRHLIEDVHPERPSPPSRDSREAA